MKLKPIVAVLVGNLTIAACAGGCGSNDDSDGRDSAAAVTTAATSHSNGGTADTSRKRRDGSRVKVMSSRYGKVLFDGRGRALYLFTREKRRSSRCYGECARAWPPFYTRGRPRAGDGAQASLISTTKRRGGRRQVTYDGHPLYYYVSDRAPGQITCQDVVEFGGTWLVVSPGGEAVQ